MQSVKLIARFSDWKLITPVPPDWVYELTPRKERKNRSNKQNAYYWAVVVPCIAWHMGEFHPVLWLDTATKESMHELLKEKFLQKSKKKVVCPTDKRRYVFLKTQQSTTKLDTKEFEMYIERIKHFFYKWKWYIPPPDDLSPKPWDYDYH